MSTHSSALAGYLLLSLTAMGVSRKIFGPEIVSQRLVPHRSDIGVATFFTIIVAAAVHMGMLDASLGPGGDQHLIPAAIAQLGYLTSLVLRGDLPPKHPHRLVLLVLVWVGLATGTGELQVLLQVASLWIVKLRLDPGGSTAKASDSDTGQKAADGPFIGKKRSSKSPPPGTKSKAASAAPKRGRKKR